MKMYGSFLFPGNAAGPLYEQKVLGGRISRFFHKKIKKNFKCFL